MRWAGRALVVGAGAVAATAAVTAVNHRRWGRAEDATEGDPLGLPDGRQFTVTSADGAELWAVEVGPDDPEAPVVVLSHCWTGDHRVWAAVARRLAREGRRVVLYDQRGHGSSTVGSDGLSLELLAHDLRAVLEHVDARDVVLAGHSMGGMAVQSFALHHPEVAAERVSRLVLVATAGDHGRYGRSLGGSLGPVVGRAVTGRLVSSSAFGAATVRGVFGRQPSLPQLRATALTFNNTPATVRTEMLAVLVAMDLSEGLASIPFPTSIVVGSLDTLTPVARARRMHDLLPDSTLVILPGRGHMLPFEAPDEVTDLILDRVGAL